MLVFAAMVRGKERVEQTGLFLFSLVEKTAEFNGIFLYECGSLGQAQRALQ